MASPPDPVESEFAAIDLAVDHAGNGPRLRLADRRTGRVRYLDALELVIRLYPALAAGAEATLVELLAPDFVGHLAAGLPAPIGGRHDGPRAMIDDGWWAIGRRFKVRAEPEEWYPCGGGRLVVLGRYKGRHRGPAERAPVVDAAFAHLWTAAGGRLCRLVQVTDTVAWGLPRA